MKKFEKNLKEKIKSVEKDIPETLEANFLERLEKITPDELYEKPTFTIKHRIAAIAALLLLVILYLFFPLSTKKETLPQPREILVHSVNLEGKPAEAYIFREKNPDLTVIWIAKNSEGAL